MSEMILTLRALIACIRRQAQSQIVQSCRMEGRPAETMRKRIVRAFWSIVYLCYAIRVGLAFLGREVLGEHVIYRGRQCYVVNWANSDSPTLGTLEGPCETLKYCRRADIATIYRPSTFLFRFVGGFTWWADNWFGIAVNKRLYSAAFAYRQEAT